MLSFEPVRRPWSTCPAAPVPVSSYSPGCRPGRRSGTALRPARCALPTHRVSLLTRSLPASPVWCVLVTGLIAIVRGGFDGPMSTPVVQVLGFTHTTTLGLIEIGLGLALLLSAATRSRSGEVFFGAVLGIAGFVGAVQTESFKKTLALESSMAWLAVAIGVIVVLGSIDAAPLRPAVDSRQ